MVKRVLNECTDVEKPEESLDEEFDEGPKMRFQIPNSLGDQSSVLNSIDRKRFWEEAKAAMQEDTTPEWETVAGKSAPILC